MFWSEEENCVHFERIRQSIFIHLVDNEVGRSFLAIDKRSDQSVMILPHYALLAQLLVKFFQFSKPSFAILAH
jgi:hypothetical protein